MTKENMEAWDEASTTIWHYCKNYFNPHFCAGSYEDGVVDFVCLSDFHEAMLLVNIPEEVKEEFLALFPKAKARMLIEMGFDAGKYIGQVMGKEILDQMNCKLALRIQEFERITAGDAGIYFYNLLMKIVRNAGPIEYIDMEITFDGIK